jgi:hypothetical protein
MRHRAARLASLVCAAGAVALAGCDRGQAPRAASIAASAQGMASAASNGTPSSRTLGTSPPPNDGTLPSGTEGSTGSRRGGGKS